MTVNKKCLIEAKSGTTSRQSVFDAVTLVLLLAFVSPALAAIPESCLSDAAKRFGHNPKVLHAILLVESSGNCSAVGPRNANGTYDIGCMQINSSWLPLLETKFHISEKDLYDPCTNINVGAWVYAKKKRIHGDNWRAVGAYNASNETKRKNYAWKVNAKLFELRRAS